ncbi:hypothetical protein GS399_05815 [Pedobacter sp. HMF7647]|uniref:Carboxypeptidase-like regulatory domain-containing protein n=1 Tax=Hufsiella arboris TaxID=2695275 RepID=A0A7K1Y7E0_9SPHI|nr:carboxypeptidase-like regulatory domain-containing protein [Hufsiella arboris]MXV50483.1 hypothetical protein [Hufsiella arboris]
MTLMKMMQSKPMMNFFLKSALCATILIAPIAVKSETSSGYKSVKNFPRNERSNAAREKNSNAYISGNVYDITKNGPLQGATIVIMGTSYSSVTNADGTFKIIVPKECQDKKITLQVRCTGYEVSNLDVSTKKLPASQSFSIKQQSDIQGDAAAVITE